MKAFASRHLREWGLLLLLLLGLLVAALRMGWFDRLDHGLYDLSIAASGRAASDAVLVLAIDEASLAGIGRWPWPRQRLAEVLDRLADAGSGPVLLDVILAEPQRDDPAGDAQLAAAITRHGRVVLPVFMPSPAAPAVRPLPAFAASARLGHAQALVDSDGVNRRYLPQENAADGVYPHVSVLLQDASRAGSAAADLDTARLVPFAGPPGHFQRLPVADLLAGRIDPARLRGRVVLLGATATGLGDNLVTPLAGVGGTMPGVEFVANIVDGARSGQDPRQLGPIPRLVLSVLVLVALMLALLFSSPRVALACTVAVVVGVALLAWWGLRLAGWWWPPAAPMVLAALAYPLWSWRRLESSLSTMARETTRIAALVQPGARPARVAPVGGFLDPVESRISAISQAVDRIAEAVVVDADGSDDGRYRDEMMRHLAHDLRSPLVSLRSLAEQLRGSGDGAVDTAMLARIDACARRSLELTEQFLLLGRAQALDPARLAEVDLVQLLHQSADDLWEDAQREGGRIERACALDIALVRGDARLLQRALMNLVWNGLRHGPRGGTVTVTLEAAPPRSFVLTVHDAGAGFPPEQLQPLAQAYAQADKARSSAQGHGLGLALVRLVADRHGAQTVAFHPPGGGFSISLRFFYT